MNTIPFKVNKNIIQKIGGYSIASSENNYTKFDFQFSDDWNKVGIQVSATMFFDSDKIPDPVLLTMRNDNTGYCYLPSALKDEHGTLKLGLTGAYVDDKNEKVVINTLLTSLTVGPGAYMTKYPANDIYLNILAKISDMANKSSSFLDQIKSMNLSKVNVDEFTKKNLISEINNNKFGYFTSENTENIGTYVDGKYTLLTVTDNTVRSKWVFDKVVDNVAGKYYLGFDYKTNIDFNVGIKLNGKYKDLGKISAITDGELHSFVIEIDVENSIGIYEVYLPNKGDLNCEISNIFIMNDIDYHKSYESFGDFLRFINKCDSNIDLLAQNINLYKDNTLKIENKLATDLAQVNRKLNLFKKVNLVEYINLEQCGKFVSENANNTGKYDSDNKSYNIVTSSDNSKKSYWNFIQDVNVPNGTYYIGFDYKTNSDFHFCIRKDNVFVDLGNIGAITDNEVHRCVFKVDITAMLNIYQIYLPEKRDINCTISNIFVMDEFDFLKSTSSLEDFINHSQSEIFPEIFGAVGNGIYDDTDALQSAINYCIANGTQLKLQNGKTYCISKSLNLSNTAALIIDGNWATLKAIKTMDYMISYDGSANTKNDVKTVVKNITADCNGVAGFIDLVYSFKFNLENFLIKNCKTTAINIQKGGSFVCQNGTIVGDCTPDCRAIYNATSDCHFSEIVIIDMKKAVFNGGTNFYSKVHAWLTGNVANSTFFSHFAGFASLSQCQCDTYETGYLMRTSYDLSLNSCTYYNNYHLYDSDTTPVVFRFNTGISPYARRISCNNCSFNSPNIIAVMSNVENAQITFSGYTHFINIDGYDKISRYIPYLQAKVTADFDNSLNRITYRNNLCYYDFSLKFTSQVGASNLLEIATIASPYYPAEAQMFQVFLSKTLAGSDCIVAKMFMDTSGKITLRIPSGNVSDYQYIFGHIYYEPKKISN